MRCALGSVFLVAGVVALASPSRAQGVPAATPIGYAIFALEDVRLGFRARVGEGDVGANTGEVELVSGSQVAGMVAGNAIRLGARTKVGGLLCRLLVPRGRQQGTCATVTIPLVDAGELPLVQVIPGAAAVTVPPRGRAAALQPGSYADVRVGERGLLTLEGGTYAVQALTIAERGALTCLAPCQIGVHERVFVGQRARLEAASGVPAGSVRVDVQGGGRKPALLARLGSTVAATVYAPNGDVSLGDFGTFTGSFVGRTVKVGQRARVTAAGGS